jgi:hypothetical protein
MFRGNWMYTTSTGRRIDQCSNRNRLTSMRTTIKPGQGFFVKDRFNKLNVYQRYENQYFRHTVLYDQPIQPGCTVFWLNLSDAKTNVVESSVNGYTTGSVRIWRAIDAVYFNDSPLALTSPIGGNGIIQGRRSICSNRCGAIRLQIQM